MAIIYVDRATDNAIEVVVRSAWKRRETIRFAPDEREEAERYALQRIGNVGIMISSLDIEPSSRAMARMAKQNAAMRGVVAELESRA